MLDLPHGIILVTGPTGSGKTTTLYAGLSKINNADLKIITIEDPVEYQLRGINQIQVNTKSGLTFGAGLRAILRHDPTWCLIGEIRDKETAEIAVQASLTGHLVFSTLHTNDAPGATTRLIDMGVEPYLVSSSVELIMAQRLVRLICPKCKEEVPDSPDLDNARRLYGAPPSPTRSTAGTDAANCQNTGYRGRQGVFEIMPMTDEIRSLVVERTSVVEIRKIAMEPRNEQPPQRRLAPLPRRPHDHRRSAPQHQGRDDQRGGRGVGRGAVRFEFTRVPRAACLPAS